ncbi:MAG TPA: DNA-formamidopyrimidine glycosylase [Gammaproteobacteria bacterium]|nr:DNA-formamidopyrimidine glycosylase [Gammaproteobacteria bacterium]|tara:strand:+ start:55 stop:867 length:813 start_codon:yes stop_codon:yes gene_type:complete
MPELPEVETTRRGIEPYVVGREIKWVAVREPRLRWPVADSLAQSITGQTFDAVKRRAKYLLLSTSNGRLMLHLGMSGSLRVLEDSIEPGKHDHVDIGFEGGLVLRYRDPRRFGSIFWLPDDESHSLLDHLGPEPLSDMFSGEYLYATSRRRRVAIKTFIMNSRVVVGVGNIYANEALFRSGIHPERLAMRVSRARYIKLVDGIKSVLAEAIDAGGTTLRDFVQENGSPGYFRSSLDVYGRKDLPCVRCGRILKEIRQGGRSTVLCSNCQS